MKHFVLVFDRRDGRVLQESEHPNSRAAMHARFEAEALHRSNRDIEVVVLSADSAAALRRTHSRYFEDLGSLVRLGAERFGGSRVASSN